jgi:nicotinate-nucleotide--dimethylbenzimidazole phosphoribosyltransferase
MKMTFSETIKNIKTADAVAAVACKKAWNNVAKPLNSMGMFEDITCRMAAAQKKSRPSKDCPYTLVFCADNGVVEEGVSQSDSSVTSAVALSVARGESNVSIMAKKVGSKVFCYDTGMKDDINDPGISVFKRKNGTNNFTKGPAMSRDDAVYAIEVGINAAERAVTAGADILLVGEMGIGNTTTSSAVLHVLTKLPIEVLTGRGSGLSDEGLDRKKSAIGKCVEINKPDPSDAIDVLSKCGGFDIAAICGVCLGAAALDVPVILDGVISLAAALVAMKIKSECVSYMIASHVSKEPAAAAALKALGLEAPISADLALGEGTGAVLLLPMIDLALTLLYGGHSFNSIGVDAYVPQGTIK